MSPKEQSDIRRKLKVLNYAKEIKHITKACRYYGISRETFYTWKRAYEALGETGLISSKPCPENPKLRTRPEVEELILHLRKTYHLGQMRIMWYLARYQDIQVSSGAVYNVLKRNGLNKLPQNERKRSLRTFKR